MTQDTTYRNFETRRPEIAGSVKSLAATRLYAELVKDALNEYAYDASIAGLDYTFDGLHDSLTISISGYNDKLHVLAKAILDKAKASHFREERFVVMKEEVLFSHDSGLRGC